MSDDKPARQFVVVDVESSGLDPGVHAAVEIAWWNLSTGERDCFIPCHDVSDTLACAQIEALRINRYIDRIAGQPQDTNIKLTALGLQLNGNTLAGSNPAFDEGFLRPLLPDALAWHHRKWDLSAYATGVLGLSELPGLSRVCELLDIPAPDHTAEGDVTATGRCFMALFVRTGITIPGASERCIAVMRSGEQCVRPPIGAGKLCEPHSGHPVTNPREEI